MGKHLPHVSLSDVVTMTDEPTGLVLLGRLHKAIRVEAKPERKQPAKLELYVLGGQKDPYKVVFRADDDGTYPDEAEEIAAQGFGAFVYALVDVNSGGFKNERDEVVEYINFRVIKWVDV